MRLGLVDLGGIGDAFVGLRHGPDQRQPPEHVHHLARAGLCKFVSQLSGGLAIYWRGRDVQHRARIKPLFHLHDRDAGLFVARKDRALDGRSEEHTSELQSLMRISYAVFCLKKKIKKKTLMKNKTMNHIYKVHNTTTKRTAQTRTTLKSQ